MTPPDARGPAFDRLAPPTTRWCRATLSASARADARGISALDQTGFRILEIGCGTGLDTGFSPPSARAWSPAIHRRRC